MVCSIGPNMKFIIVACSIQYPFCRNESPMVPTHLLLDGVLEGDVVNQARSPANGIVVSHVTHQMAFAERNRTHPMASARLPLQPLGSG